MKWFSMFSGIGGFELGLIKAGHEVVAGCEIDEHARSVYARHFPETRIYEDATKINPSELPDFDGLCGGFPCQAFSIAGRRKGFEDTRGTLFFEIARIAKERRPAVLFLENVRGLLSHDKGRTFETIIKTLDEIGYDAEWQCINGKYFLPQNRERVFIVGHLRGSGSRQIFPLGCDGKEADENRPSVRTLTGGAHSGGLHSQMTMIAWSKSTRDWGVESRIKEGEANTINTGQGGCTQSSMTIIKIVDSQTQQDRIYSQKGISPTIPSSSGGRHIPTIDSKERFRRLTPLECERLQGFPDGWTEGISDTQRYKCVGNAVMVPVIEFIGKHFSLDVHNQGVPEA